MFDPSEMPESKSGYKLLAKGGYRLIVAEATFQYKTGFPGNNWFKVRFDVLPYHGAGEYQLAGRRITNLYTWENPNSPKARDIGRSQLADLMFAVGSFVKIESPQELPPLLLNRELYAEIYHGKRRDGTGLEERIGDYWTVDGKQRKKDPKPIPAPPTEAAIAAAPPQAPRNSAPAGSHAHPAFDPEVPF